MGPSAKASGNGVAADDPRTRRPVLIDLAIVIAFAATFNVITFRCYLTAFCFKPDLSNIPTNFVEKGKTQVLPISVYTYWLIEVNSGYV